ncbi:MAG: C13 family peptidase [Rhodoferax sp.]|uniref:C13 family peptidase n=1 Tax=Rhodoferax sp. TaxID=50421 RepID=UPI0026385CFA|nr:C13 family peptidase [Rhodoferax sp.]MDD5333750.1 C13 family peptidase [Rhodoferax sp.]
MSGDLFLLQRMQPNMRNVRQLLVLVVTLLVGCALPPGYRPEFRQINASLVDRALQPLRSSFTTPPDKPLGVYMGVALDGASPAFDGDIRRARNGLFLQAASGPSLLLSNLQAEPQGDPHADFATMPTAARAAGQWLQSQSVQTNRTPFAMVVIASHGQDDMLMVRAGKTQILALINGSYINAFLNDFGAVPTIVIISACHAGSLIPALRAPNRIIIAAAASDRVSFGCGADSTSTVFMQALLDKELDRSFSLEDLFIRGRNRVIGLEMRLKMQHSLPVMDVGSDMEVFAVTPLAKWSTALREFRMSKH